MNKGKDKTIFRKKEQRIIFFNAAKVTYELKFSRSIYLINKTFLESLIVSDFKARFGLSYFSL